MLAGIRFREFLETTQVESAIHVNDLAGGVVEQAAGDGAYRFGDVRTFADPALRNQPPRDALFVRLLDRRDHIGSDDAWANFENLNSMRSQSLRVKCGGHAERCL